MKKCIVANYILFLIISIVDLYLNYKEKDFPEYHEKRIKYNICNLFLVLLSILIPKSPRYLCLNIIFFIIIEIFGIYYVVSSFYLYIAYDGIKKIKSSAIQILMWISFISFLISLLSGCSRSNSSDISADHDSNNIELEEQIV